MNPNPIKPNLTFAVLNVVEIIQISSYSYIWVQFVLYVNVNHLMKQFSLLLSALFQIEYTGSLYYFIHDMQMLSSTAVHYNINT